MRITTYKLELVKEKATNYGDKEFTINNPSNIANFLSQACKMDKQAEEILVLICLDTKNKITGYHEVSRGTVNSSLVHPREVFKRALLNNANAIIIAHNHPSGNTYPSAEDLKITRRIKEAGELLGVELLDHVIIGDNGDFYSFKRDDTL